jgi:hypothetical protein
MKMCKAGTYCINNVQTDCPEGYTSKEGSGACQRKLIKKIFFFEKKRFLYKKNLLMQG